MTGDIERRTITAQVAGRIEAEIRANVWRESLPGKRTLAERYNVNVKTAAASLDLLERRGLIGPGSAGKGRAILPRPKIRNAGSGQSDRRLLVIHQSGGMLNTEDYKLLQRMSDVWARTQGEVAWTAVDFARCKSPGAQLAVLIKRHAADALLMLMPGGGWHREAAARLPFYMAGGPFEDDIPVSLGACKLGREITRVVQYLRDLGHRRISFPSEGADDWMWRAIVTGMQGGAAGKPEYGTWEDWCPRFPDNVPEAWESYWKKTFTRLRPTAVIVHEDTHLLSLYGYCSDHGIRIPADLSIVSISYEPRFEWMRPKPAMMRYPANLALAHFQRWIEGGLKPIGPKFFPLEMREGGSLKRNP